MPSASFACSTVAGRLLLLPRGLAHDVLARSGTEPPGRLASKAAEPQPRLVCSGLQRHGQGSLKARGQCHELRARRMALRTELTVHLHGVGFSKVKEEDRHVYANLASESDTRTIRLLLGFLGQHI